MATNLHHPLPAKELENHFDFSVKQIQHFRCRKSAASRELDVLAMGVVPSDTCCWLTHRRGEGVKVQMLGLPLRKLPTT